MNQLVIQGYYF